MKTDAAVSISVTRVENHIRRFRNIFIRAQNLDPKFQFSNLDFKLDFWPTDILSNVDKIKYKVVSNISSFWLKLIFDQIVRQILNLVQTFDSQKFCHFCYFFLSFLLLFFVIFCFVFFVIFCFFCHFLFFLSFFLFFCHFLFFLSFFVLFFFVIFVDNFFFVFFVI